MGSELVAGIDAARTGWVVCVVELGAKNASVEFLTGATLGDVWDDEWAVVGIDMPIGLPTGDRRAADREARAILGPRSSTLFSTPDHATLAATDYEDALARSRAACGRGLSKQAFHLLPRVREVRGWLGGPTDFVHEVHPETSFTAMNDGVPLARKTSAVGRTQRAGLLTAWMPMCSSWATGLSIDALDAAAAAWTATRIVAGEHRILGDNGVDPDGHRLSMAV
ncbi:MAG: DUF429 domain-containing protein [Acidimicrobiia bacterium]|nr:DUF429 domain-containing protein [Acidimicrobiia bacterium]